MTGHRAQQPPTRAHDRRRSMAVTAMLGIGLMAAVDEIVFHQILAWHHFYDRSTSGVALLSDGLLHTGELVLIVAGGFGFADLRRRHALATRPAWAGLLLGAGAFQLFDGLVDHKLLRVHQVRYHVDLLPYDLAWNLVGVALLIAGAALARPGGRSSRSRSSRSRSSLGRPERRSGAGSHGPRP